jgi:D-xylose transport system substrate-binding protein
VKKLIIAIGIAVLAVGLTVGAAFAKSGSAAADADACVLLPDSKSSVRWETQDRRFLAAAFKAANVTYSIVNAEGDAQRQRSQADQCLLNNAKVILLVNLDSGSARAIQNAAAAKGVKVIDYDRLTLGGKTAYYVSFNNPEVGKLMGTGVVADMRKKAILGAGKKPVVAYLNGGPTDNNSKLFKQGYAGVIDPLFKSGAATKGPDQSVPGWDNQKARTIFEGMLAKTGNKIDAVAAANDGLANAVVTALKAKKLDPIPVSGQDATAGGVQNVISGWQSGTVYKSIKLEANAAAQVAINIIKGRAVKTNGRTSDGKRNVPSVLLKPIWITKSNYTLLFTDGFLKKGEVCRGEFKKFC